MIKHTIELSQRGTRVRLEKKQLKIHCEDSEHSYACEDIAVLMLQNPAISLTGHSLDALARAGAVVVICDGSRLPSGILYPVHSHSRLIPRMQDQLKVKRPLLKQAWKKIIQAKLKAQANNLVDPYKSKLEYMSKQVRSGDPDNFEAQASKLYWKHYFQEQYQLGDKRDPLSDTRFNSLLNYGYTILRAALVRSIVSAGLIPALGVFHKKRDNPFCLADDLIEPLRPLVDRVVKELLSVEDQTTAILNRNERKTLLRLLARELIYKDLKRPLMVCLPAYVNSYFEFISKQSIHFHIPEFK